MLTIPSRRYIRRFLAWVDRQPDGCWVWIGSTSRGYGIASYHSLRGAHRVAWFCFVGGIPKGADVLHHCDNRLCCNPAHLHLGDDVMNAREREARGRSRRGQRRPLVGEEHFNARLTDAQVVALRTEYATLERHPRGWFSRKGRELGVTGRTISYLVHGDTWRHLK